MTARVVISNALGMFRQSFARIATAALVFFALPAVLAVLAESAVESVTPEHSALAVYITFIAAASAVSLRVLGPVAFAGFLDEAVASEYFRGRRHRLPEVLRTLPWRRLVVADVVVVLAVAVGLVLFVLPGLVIFGLLVLVGPVIVQERDALVPSFRRTIKLASSVPLLVGGLIVVPFAIEQVVHESIIHSLHDSGLGVLLLAEWILSIVLGGTLGVLEVALASELMARNPRVAADGESLLDDGQAPAV